MTTSTSATIPKTNMKVVIPNMNFLGGDEVKPGLILNAIYCKHASPFLRKNNSQEDATRGNVDYDICTYDHSMEGAKAQKLDE